MKHNTLHTRPFVEKGLMVLALAALLPALTAWGDSATVAYQGTLNQPDTLAVADGSYPMLLSIWDAEIAGNKLWEESHAAVGVSAGAFSVTLGETTALSTLFSDNSALWLEVAVDVGSGSEAYSPRMPLQSAPYAQQVEESPTADNAIHAATADSATNASTAVDADTIDGLDAADMATVSHSHSGSSLVSGILSTDRYSAYTDLVLESKIGTGAAQISQGDHTHSGPYYWYGQVGGQTSGTKTLNEQGANGIACNGTQLIAPVTGTYYVHFQQLANQDSSASYLHMQHNGATQVFAYLTSGPSVSKMRDVIVDRVVKMNAGDTIQFVLQNSQTTAWSGAHSTVSMYQITN